MEIFFIKNELQEQNSNWYSFENERSPNQKPLKKKQKQKDNYFDHRSKEQQTNSHQFFKVFLKNIG